jgi:hypothetical protein
MANEQSRSKDDYENSTQQAPQNRENSSEQDDADANIGGWNDGSPGQDTSRERNRMSKDSSPDPKSLGITSSKIN